MAMNKIERIDKEIAKTREKITEYQNRLRGLEAQKTEAENLQIVQLVRSMRLSPHELSAMLSGGGIPGMEAAPGYPAEPADHDTEEMEDTEYQNRLRGLEAQKTEAENLQIVQLVRSMRLSPHELSAMLSGGGIPGMEAAPGYPAEPADHDTEEMEDTENE